MRKILYWVAALSMAALAWSATEAAAAKKKAPVKKTAPGATAKNSPAKSSATHHGKKGSAKAATWRNRQLAPSPERYKEIQAALAAKGYLPTESANGTWGQASVQALKKFQADQNIASSGKINSLSLIALGLGPKRDAPATDAGGSNR